MINIMKEYETIKRLNIQNDIHTSNKKPLCPLKPRKKQKSNSRQIAILDGKLPLL